MATLTINQQTTKSNQADLSFGVSHLQTIANLQAISQANAANASTGKSRLGFLAILLRSLAVCAV